MSDHLLTHAVTGYPDAFSVTDRLALDSAFAQFYAAAFPKVYAFARCQVGDADRACELVSRIFLKAYRHRDKAPAGPAMIQWLFRIAHTTVIDYRRVDGRRESVQVSIEELTELPDALSSPEASYASKERAALLLKVIGDLADQDRQLLALKFAAQRTNREIASIMGLTEGAVSMRLLRALRRLRERLLELGL